MLSAGGVTWYVYSHATSRGLDRRSVFPGGLGVEDEEMEKRKRDPHPNPTYRQEKEKKEPIWKTKRGGVVDL